MSVRHLLLFTLCAALLLSGCMVHPRPTSAQPPKPVKVDIPPPTVKDGSLWQEDATLNASLTADDKACRRGDVLTVLVVETVNATRKRNTSTSRKQAIDAMVNNISIPGLGPVVGPVAALNGHRDFTVNLNSTRTMDGAGTITDQGDVRATISAQVVNVLSNGNLVIQGSKEVTVSGEVQTITLTGIVRPKDISPQNVVLSTSLAEARVHIAGSGPLDDAVRRTVVARVCDWINLF